MIGKIPKTGKGFRGTFNYLVRGKKDAENPERLSWMETRNLFVDDMEKVPSMMRATASQSSKCQKPVYHFLISWRDDEAPADPTMRAVADHALADLGLQDHQAVLAAHRDTAHRHLHIMVNRVHPETGKAWHTGKDWERLERSIARQALELGFLKVDGRHNTPEKMAREAKRVRDTEYQMATRKHATVPLDRWSLTEIRSRRAQLGPIFDQARSWDHLERLLNAEGLSLTAKGQGLIIDDGMGFMKLSDLGKQVRLKGLEDLFQERFFAFDRRRNLERFVDPETSPVTERTATERPHIARGRAKPDKPPASGDADSSADQLHQRKDDKDRDADTEPTQGRDSEEAEREALREKWRTQRLAARAAVQRPAKPSPENADEDPPPQRELPKTGAASPEASPRQEAFASLTGAHEKLDLSRKLHAMGLIGEQDLKRAQEDVEAAREEVIKHQTFSEFVGDGVREALAPPPKPQPEMAAPKPPVRKKPKPQPKHDKENDRDR